VHRPGFSIQLSNFLNDIYRVLIGFFSSNGTFHTRTNKNRHLATIEVENVKMLYRKTGPMKTPLYNLLSFVPSRVIVPRTKGPFQMKLASLHTFF
jgi:hypothetical protein